MTIEEFNETRFGAQTFCLYRNEDVYQIVAVSFTEALVELHDGDKANDFWVRIENITMIV